MKKAEKQVVEGVVVRECVEADAVVKAGAGGDIKGCSPADVRFAWTLAVNGLRAMVAFGAMMADLDRVLTRETTVDSGGRITGREPGLKDWLAENCPDINYKTAMRFKRLAEIALAESGAGTIRAADAVRMLATPDTAFYGSNPEEARQREALDRFLSGKSQRDILQAWAEGGGKPGKVRGSYKAALPAARKTPEESLAEARAKSKELAMTARNCLRCMVTDELWQYVPAAELRPLLKDIKADLAAIAAATA